jgi:hypothetical protein
LRAGGVPQRVSERAEGCTSLADALNQLKQLPSRATQAIELGDHHNVTRAYRSHKLGQLWAISAHPTDFLAIDGSRAHEVLFGILYKDDVDWSSGIGYARSGIDSIRIHEIDEGQVYERDGVKITAATVKHTVLTYAYRFEYADKRIVFSGDTAICDALVKCAQARIC